MTRFYFKLEGVVQCAEMEIEHTYQDIMEVFRKHNIKPDGAVLGVVK